MERDKREPLDNQCKWERILPWMHKIHLCQVMCSGKLLHDTQGCGWRITNLIADAQSNPFKQSTKIYYF